MTKVNSPQDLVRHGHLVSFTESEEECTRYLEAAIALGSSPLDDEMGSILNRTSGMLITVINFLKDRSQTGMIMDSIELLIRLVGLSTDVLN